MGRQPNFTSVFLPPSPFPPVFLFRVLIQVLLRQAGRAGDSRAGFSPASVKGYFPTQQWRTKPNKMRFDPPFQSPPSFFRKPLSHIRLFSAPWLLAKTATGEEHTAQTLLLFFMPHPLPNGPSRTEGKQSSVVQGLGLGRCAVLTEASGPEQSGQDSRSVLRPMLLPGAGVRCRPRLHRPGGGVSHTVKKEARSIQWTVCAE